MRQAWSDSVPLAGLPYLHDPRLSVDREGNVVVLSQTFTGGSGPGAQFHAARFSEQGQLLWQVLSPSTRAEQFYPLGSSLDAAGNVTVAATLVYRDSADKFLGNAVYLAKYAAADGHLLWESRSNSAADALTSGRTAYGTAADADGNFFVAGLIGGPSKPYAAKYDATDGHLLWESIHARVASDSSPPRILQVDVRGDLFLAGDLYVVGADPNLVRGAYVMKCGGADGAITWTSMVSTPGDGPFHQEQPLSLLLDPDGNPLLQTFEGLVTATTNTMTMIVRKFRAADGAEAWHQTHPFNETFGTPGAVLGDPAPDTMAVDGRGDVFMGGVYPAPAGTCDAFVLKYSGADGAPAWEQRFAGVHGSEDYADSLCLDRDENPVLAGRTRHGTALTAKDRGTDAFAVKFNSSDGTALWERDFAGPSIGTNDLTKVVPFPSGGIALASTAVVGSNYVVRVLVPDDSYTAPILDAPVLSMLSSDSVAVRFSLPQPAEPGSVTLNFKVYGGTEVHAFTLADSQATAVLHSFTFDTANPTAFPEIAAGSALPDGAYSVTLSYRVAATGDTATADNGFAVIDRAPPVITGPFSPLIVRINKVPDYAPQAHTADTTKVTLVQSYPNGYPASPGTWPIMLTGTDELGHTASITFNIEARDTQARTAPLAKPGDAAPGAGSLGGPPADARFTSFGVPAIDDTGTVAFTAGWHSATTGAGRGLFTTDRCVAIAGSNFPELGSATLQDFTAPVVAGGKVACIGTLSHAAPGTNSTVLSETTGSLEVVARTGDLAPDAGGAIFTAFRAVSPDPSGTAFFARFAGGSGQGKITAASGWGVWFKPNGAPALLLLAEGQAVEDTTIQKLLTFSPGHGSPGQGRGWFTAAGTPRALAWAQLADGSQAILTGAPAGLGMLASTSLYARPGSVVSLGRPAALADGAVAFSARVIADRIPGIHRGTSVRALFVDEPGSWGDPIFAGSTRLPDGSRILDFADPILSADGSLAFTATVLPPFSANSTTYVCWRRPGHSLDFVRAAVGYVYPFSGAHIAHIDSLALLDGRGPLFVASFASHRGPLNPANDSAVYAVDSLGAAQLLFTETETIPSDVSRRFDLLKALPGSPGLTRSFNNRGEVVWRATLRSGGTALMRTVVP